jgi:hypothetical protein
MSTGKSFILLEKCFESMVQMVSMNRHLRQQRHQESQGSKNCKSIYSWFLALFNGKVGDVLHCWRRKPIKVVEFEVKPVEQVDLLRCGFGRIWSLAKEKKISPPIWSFCNSTMR